MLDRDLYLIIINRVSGNSSNTSSTAIQPGDQMSIHGDRKDTRYLINRFDNLLNALLNVEASHQEDEAIDAVIAGVISLGYSNVMISLLLEEGDRKFIRAVRAHGAEWEQIKEMTVREYPGNDLLARVLQSGESSYIPDSRGDSYNDQKAIRKSKIISQYVIPMSSNNVPIGTIQVSFGNRARKPLLQCKMLDALASHLSLAIAKFRAIIKLRDANMRMVEFGTLAIGNQVAAVMMHQLKPEIRKLQDSLAQKLKEHKYREHPLVKSVLQEFKTEIDVWKDRIEKPLQMMVSTGKRERISANDAVQKMVTFWHPEARLRGCNLRFRDHTKTVKIEVIESHFKEVLSCLVVNAIQAKARNIDITLTHTVKTITEKTQELMAVVTVEDDGLGIPADIVTRLFDLGFTTKGNSGTGMGLYIVRVLVVEMDGTIKLVSQGKSSGKQKTIFKLTLPAYT